MSKSTKSGPAGGGLTRVDDAPSANKGPVTAPGSSRPPAGDKPAKGSK